jgi:hypothetical protein
MPFVPGRETNTSICTSCYRTVRPQSGQSLSAVESEHSCESARSISQPMPKLLPVAVETPQPITLKGSWRITSTPDWEECTFRLFSAKSDESAETKRAVERPDDDQKLLP